MISVVNDLAVLGPAEKRLIFEAEQQLKWHISNMLKQIASVTNNPFLTLVYSDICQQLFCSYSLATEKFFGGDATALPIDYRGDVEKMLLRLHNVDYEMLPRNKVKAIATGNGEFLMEVR